jgi:thiol-disulfide isomerase/thioredoxin
MKTSARILIASLMVSAAQAEFRIWTRNDGKTAELDLISVTDSAGAKTGEFKMRNGKSVSLAASTLAEADAKLLAEWKPAEAAASPTTAGSTVFDKLFDGNLVKLSGKSLKTAKDVTKPEKYYLFYYTASWCGPCHKFTPSLVDFYNKNKDASFEVVLITSDSDESAMEGYAEEMKMPWPQLKLSKAEKFKEEFKYPGGGIPNLVLTDLQGTLIKGSYEGKNYVGPNVVMNHLSSLLKK